MIVLIAVISLFDWSCVLQAEARSFCDEDGWNMVWRDEFDQDSLDLSSWTMDLHGNDSRVREALGTASNVWLEDGHLVLRSQRESRDGFEFTSGAVETKGKRSWEGPTRVCIKAILPGVSSRWHMNRGSNDGIWPAHWLMPVNRSNWPSDGEIDIMEMDNGNAYHHATYHWCDSVDCLNHKRMAGGKEKLPPDWSYRFHEYAVEFGRGSIKFAIDNKVFTRVDNVPLYDVPYYLIINTAIGGGWPRPVTHSTKFPVYHVIDYVRVVQPVQRKR